MQIGESFEQCAAREAKEETNLDIENLKLFHVTNNPNMDNDPGKHYITIFMKVMKIPLGTHRIKNRFISYGVKGR